ncbi:MAG TPA: DNA-processing protein DprA [Candidatus Elarobacter sp.]|nr:DNA-processing protein DprA [Candidatus Elarobacter sp.]
MNPARDLPLLAAWRLRVPVRLLRALARGDHAALRTWLAAESARRIAEARRGAYADLAALEALGARLLAPADDGWPAGFADLRDPPAFLTVRGTLPSGGIAIVGARDAGEHACAFAHELAMRLGIPVVSGLAHGIDAAAHRGALAAGIPTVAYVGTGLARTFPEDHAGLAGEIVEHGGAIAAEAPPDDGATRWSLRRRDRLQAAHARAVVLVQSDAAGGAMHTMRFARDLGRARFALDDAASGNRLALDEGAIRLPQDVTAAVSHIHAMGADDRCG